MKLLIPCISFSFDDRQKFYLIIFVPLIEYYSIAEKYVQVCSHILLGVRSFTVGNKQYSIVDLYAKIKIR